MSEAASATPAPEEVITPAPEGGEQAEHDASGGDEGAVEAEALAMGWKPESQFKGPKDKFVSAAEYVERGKTIMPFLRKELVRRDREIEGLKKAVNSSIQHISRADERAYVKAKADLEAELALYAEAGDKANVKSVTDDLIKLERERAAAPKAADDTPPEMQAWMDENPWYGTDKAMTAACDAIGQEAFAEGYTGKAQIAEVDRRIRDAFPGKFAKPTNPNRNLPGAVEGVGAPARGRGGKTYADLPAEARQMCDELVRDKILTREQYVKTYDFGA